MGSKWGGMESCRNCFLHLELATTEPSRPNYQPRNEANNVRRKRCVGKILEGMVPLSGGGVWVCVSVHQGCHYQLE